MSFSIAVCGASVGWPSKPMSGWLIVHVAADAFGLHSYLGDSAAVRIDTENIVEIIERQ